MSRYSAYTHYFILLNQREQAAFTKAFVWLALKPLSVSERKTMTAFERVWFAGNDFSPDRTFAFFVDMCRRHHVRIEFMKKPQEAGRRGETGIMKLTEWTKAEVNGSYWPNPKHSDGTKKTIAETVAQKAKYRTLVKLLEMARLGVGELTFSHEQIETMVDRKVGERIREFDTVQPVEAAVPTPAPESTNGFTTPRIPFRVIDGGRAA